MNTIVAAQYQSLCQKLGLTPDTPAEVARQHIRASVEETNTRRTALAIVQAMEREAAAATTGRMLALRPVDLRPPAGSALAARANAALALPAPGHFVATRDALRDFQRGQRDGLPAPGSLERGASCPPVDPRSSAAQRELCARAAAELARGDYAQAAASYRALAEGTAPHWGSGVASEPWHNDALVGLGDCYAAAGHASEAVRFYERAAGDYSPMGSGPRDKNVERAMQRLLDVDPSHPKAARFLARALVEQALTELDYQADFHIENPEVGSMAEAKAHMDKGLALLERAANICREVVFEDPGVVASLGKTLLRQGQDERALGVLFEASRRLPNDAVLARELQVACGFVALWKALSAGAGDPVRSSALEEAKHALSRAIELDPADPRAMTMYYRTLYELDGPEAARALNDALIGVLGDFVLRRRIYPAGPDRPIDAPNVELLEATHVA